MKSNWLSSKFVLCAACRLRKTRLKKNPCGIKTVWKHSPGPVQTADTQACHERLIKKKITHFKLNIISDESPLCFHIKKKSAKREKKNHIDSVRKKIVLNCTDVELKTILNFH